MDERAIAIALLTKPEHQRLYQTSAVFKTEVDTLAAMLPRWVDGLAADAEERDAEMKRALRRLRDGHVDLGRGVNP
jgi:hypothetical protein